MISLAIFISAWIVCYMSSGRTMPSAYSMDRNIHKAVLTEVVGIQFVLDQSYHEHSTSPIISVTT